MPDTAFLHRRHALQIDHDGDILDEWQIYRCVCCELDHGGQTYVLSTGRWYRVDNNFVEAVNKFFEDIPRYEQQLPEYNDASEGAYCERVAAAFPNQYALMDRKLVQIGGAYGKVEFCDLFTTQRDMIHIKRYGASSVLSDLFSQAVVSGEAFRAERRFRAAALEYLTKPYRLFSSEQIPQPSDFQVVFAVISYKPEALELPSFSRVNLRQASRRLQAFGYRTALAKVQVAPAKAKLKRYPAQ